MMELELLDRCFYSNEFVYRYYEIMSSVKIKLAISQKQEQILRFCKNPHLHDCL